MYRAFSLTCQYALLMQVSQLPSVSFTLSKSDPTLCRQTNVAMIAVLCTDRSLHVESSTARKEPGREARTKEPGEYARAAFAGMGNRGVEADFRLLMLLTWDMEKSHDLPSRSYKFD